MVGKTRAVRLGILFVLAVIIPGVVLAAIALRSMSREEAYVEKSLEGTLRAEAGHLASRVRAELDSVVGELRDSAPSEASPDALSGWDSSLVGVPYFLSSSFDVLRPVERPGAPEEERLFLDRYGSFFTGELAVPFYQNITTVYTEEILGYTGETLGKDARRPAVNEAAESGFSDVEPFSEEPEYAQKAADVFATDESVREKIYVEAEERGQTALPRNVVPNRSVQTSVEEETPKSIFVSEPMRFQEIVAGEPFGVIPRFVDDELLLLFWMKSEEGGYIGCGIRMDVFRSRIAGLLEPEHSPIRILTLLDDRGRPLASAADERDWSRPFVAQEISETLPQWEAAAFLVDPDLVSSRAARTNTIVAVLIAILSISILTGGSVVFRGVRSEMKLAGKKTTFVANVSHELKTPLTSIRLFAEILRDRRQPDRDKQREYLDIMVSESERLTRIIDNVLDFSRPERSREYRRTSVDLVRLVEETLESQRSTLEEEGFSVSTEERSRDLTVAADREAVKQVLLNLISNAVKYSEQRREITFRIENDGSHAVVRIMDRGIGIPAKHAKRIFEEFYRGNDALTAPVRGAGLGLTIASRIVEDHGGSLLYRPRTGGGSIFEVRLPLAAEKTGRDEGRSGA